MAQASIEAMILKLFEDQPLTAPLTPPMTDIRPLLRKRGMINDSR